MRSCRSGIPCRRSRRDSRRPRSRARRGGRSSRCTFRRRRRRAAGCRTLLATRGSTLRSRADPRLRTERTGSAPRRSPCRPCSGRCTPGRSTSQPTRRIRAAGVSVEALIRGRAAGLAESPTAAAAPLVTDAQVLRARSALRRADARNAAATACAGGERVTRCECLGVAGAGACLVRGARVTGTRSTVTGAGLAVRRSRVGEPAFAAGPSSVRHARIRSGRRVCDAAASE